MNTQELIQKIAKLKDAFEAETDADLKAKFKLKIEQLEKQVAEAEAAVAKKEEVIEQKEEKKIDDLSDKLKKLKDAFESEEDADLKSRYKKRIDEIESKINSEKKEIKEEKQELKEQKQEVKEAVKEVKSPQKAVRTQAIKKAKETKEVREEVTKEKKKRTKKLEDIMSDLNSLISKSKKLSDKYKGQGVDVERDASRKAKPFGWRFKGEGDYRVPTKKQRELYPDKVDYEARPNRADVKRKGKVLLAEGGEVNIYELRKGDKVKTRYGTLETIVRKTGSGSYETIESEYTHSPESLEFVSRPNRADIKRKGKVLLAEGGGIDNKTYTEDYLKFLVSKYDFFANKSSQEYKSKIDASYKEAIDYLNGESDEDLDYVISDLQSKYEVVDDDAMAELNYDFRKKKYAKGGGVREYKIGDKFRVIKGIYGDYNSPRYAGKEFEVINIRDGKYIDARTQRGTTETFDIENIEKIKYAKGGGVDNKTYTENYLKFLVSKYDFFADKVSQQYKSKLDASYKEAVDYINGKSDEDLDYVISDLQSKYEVVDDNAMAEFNYNFRKNKYAEGGGVHELPNKTFFAKIKPYNPSEKETIVKIVPDRYNNFVAGYVIYSPFNSINKVGYLRKNEIIELLKNNEYIIIDKPNEYAEGGGVASYKIQLDSWDADIFEDDYEEGEGKMVNNFGEKENKIFDSPSELFKYLQNKVFYKDLELAAYSVIDDGRLVTSFLVDEDNSPASDSEIEKWKLGNKKLYAANYNIYISLVDKKTPSAEELSSILGVGLYAKGGKVKHSRAKDGQRTAKPRGWRWKDEALEKGLIPKSAILKTPSKYYRKKYPDYVYYEDRASKSDKKPSRKFISL